MIVTESRNPDPLTPVVRDRSFFSAVGVCLGHERQVQPAYAPLSPYPGEKSGLTPQPACLSPGYISDAYSHPYGTHIQPPQQQGYFH